MGRPTKPPPEVPLENRLEPGTVSETLTQLSELDQVAQNLRDAAGTDDPPITHDTPPNVETEEGKNGMLFNVSIEELDGLGTAYDIAKNTRCAQSKTEKEAKTALTQAMLKHQKTRYTTPEGIICTCTPDYKVKTEHDSGGKRVLDDEDEDEESEDPE